MRVFSILTFLVLTGFACEKTQEDSSLFQGLDAPAYFPAKKYEFKTNTLSPKGFELGRKLFYDSFLSVDGTISCSSCHQQKNGFSDFGTAFSAGVNGKTVKRNAPALVNLAWNPNFMWDGGITHLENMPLAPLIDSLEMGNNMRDLIARLNSDKEYPQLFNEVFGKTRIDDQQLFYAFAQFLGKMESYNSKYDLYLQGQIKYTSDEEKGLELFRMNCERCHQEPLMTNYSFQNPHYKVKTDDVGRYRVTENPNDVGKFKVPSLRNIELSSPYFHDGSVATLTDVLEEYDEYFNSNLSATEKNDLLSFLKTLTDYNYINDVRFSKPQ